MAKESKTNDAIRISATFPHQAARILQKSADRANMSKDAFTAAWAYFGAREIQAGRASMVNGQPEIK